LLANYLVVIDNFNTPDTVCLPHETYPPLVIDADAVLPLAVVLQCLQPVSGRHSQAVQLRGSVQLKQLATRNSFDIPESGHIMAVE
jgi:hypothetical protein